MLSQRDRAELGASNYFINGGGESGATGIQPFNTTFSGGVPQAITLGSTVVSIASTTSNVLSGNASNQFVCSTASGSVGQGWISDVFTLGNADLARIIALAFDYMFVSGNANVNVSGFPASQTIQMWIYNVGTASWIQPAGYCGINTNGTSSQLIPGHVANATFQSLVSNTSNNNQYRIAWIIANAPAGAFAMNIDNIYFGRQISINGPAMTDWTPYTPTFTGFTVSSYVAYWRRVGDTMEVALYCILNSAVSAPILVSLPPGYSYNLTEAGSTVGVAMAFHTGGPGTIGAVNVGGDVGNTTVRAYGPTNIGRWGATTPFTWVSSDELDMKFTVPINGWSSNTVMSSDTDTRVVAAVYTGTSTNVGSAGATTLKYSTVVKDTHGAYNTSTGIFTVPVTGLYEVSAVSQQQINISTGQGTWIQAVQTGSVSSTIILCDMPCQATGNIACTPAGTCILNCVAGDQISIQFFNGSTNTGTAAASQYHNLAISRLTGPSVIAASESVSMKYNTATTTITHASVLIPFTNKVYDTHAAYNSSTGIYTVPVSGKYRITATVSKNTTTSTAVNQAVSTAVWKNGAIDSYLGYFVYQVTGVTLYALVNGSTDIQCNAGDTLAIYAQHDSSISDSACDGGASTNFLCITRVGN